MPSFSDALGGFRNSNSPSRVASEPIEGNSLIRFLRSSFNDMSRTGQNQMESGQNLFQTSVQGFQPSVNYWESILSGNRNAMANAVAPAATQISANYDRARDQASRNLPRGGYSAVMQAELPFKKAAEINTHMQQLQPMAAQQLQGIAAQLSSLGLSQQQIGAIMRSLVVQGQLGVRGQDVAEHGQMMGLTGSLADTAASLFQL